MEGNNLLLIKIFAENIINKYTITENPSPVIFHKYNSINYFFILSFIRNEYLRSPLKTTTRTTKDNYEYI